MRERYKYIYKDGMSMLINNDDKSGTLNRQSVWFSGWLFSVNVFIVVGNNICLACEKRFIKYFSFASYRPLPLYVFTSISPDGISQYVNYCDNIIYLAKRN